MQIPLREIKVSPRQITHHDVRDMMESMRDNGQYTPIVLDRSRGKLHLVDGLIRYHAAWELGWDKIETNIPEVTPKWLYSTADSSTLLILWAYEARYVGMKVGSNMTFLFDKYGRAYDLFNQRRLQYDLSWRMEPWSVDVCE